MKIIFRLRCTIPLNCITECVDSIYKHNLDIIISVSLYVVKKFPIVAVIIKHKKHKNCILFAIFSVKMRIIPKL